MRSLFRLPALLLLTIAPGHVAAEDSQNPAPDLRTVAADLTVPPTASGPPAAGRRCRVEDVPSGTEYIVYLPRNWDRQTAWPVIVELPGNGGYRGRDGDECSGLPEDCSLGYGVTGGVDAIWICVPFLTASGDAVAETWWGDKPDYDPQPTVELLARVVDHACSPQLNGDSQRIILAGFSRGSLACNYIGLFDDQIASRWCGMICYSHYDGVREAWPYPSSDRSSAIRRLRRLRHRPQFVCHESDAPSAVSLTATRTFLQSTGLADSITFCETGFRNHNDQWVLRPSPARDRLRAWFRQAVNKQTD